MSDSKPDLQELLAFWQPLLRLSDWDIVVQYKRHMERSGMCGYEHDYKKADIEVVDPIDWRDDSRPQDVEKTLVHELLHLHFAPFKTENDSPLGTAEEHAVEMLARAFVQLKRSKS